MANLYPSLRLVILACLVAALSFLAARLGGALILRPQMVSPLWLGNVLLASMLLLAPRKIWPVVLIAGLAGFLLYDLQAGGPILSIAWLILSNALEILVAVLFLNTSFNGTPRLNSVKALVKYSFYAVFLAPFIGAFLGALSTTNNYWASWKMAFFSEALGFLTLMPAILGWAGAIRNWSQKPRGYYIEAIALIVALGVFGRLAFAAPGNSGPPILFYSLVPLLLWCTLRFGSTGVSTSMVAIAFVSIWGAVHGRGPFTEQGGITDVLSLQLFVFFMAAPFMALAVLVEERSEAEQASRQREAKLNEAQRLAKLGSWQWDPHVDAVTWSEEIYRIAGLDPNSSGVDYRNHAKLYTAESWLRLRHAVEEALTTAKPCELDLEMVHVDGTTRWVIARGEVESDAAGRVIRIRGTVQDITERKLAKEELRKSEERLSLAVHAGRMYAFEWDATTDVITRSAQSLDILDWLPYPTRDTRREFAARIHPEDREAYVGLEARLTPENPTYKSSYRVLRPGGSVLWLEANGRAVFDDRGKIQSMIGLVADVTDRKLAEDVLSSLSSRLIDAQEQECARIARELHDDLSQRMALLQIGLGRFEQNMPDLSSRARQELRDIAEVGAEVSCALHSLSHQLHPSKLELLGLAAALEGYCREFSGHYNRKVQFFHHDIPRQVPKDVTICLFRIMQEALRNVVKHSRATEAKVELTGRDDRIDLCISDFGVGFDPKSANGNTGLGLISMRERLRLVRGHLSIESRPSYGTQIHVRVPFAGKRC